MADILVCSTEGNGLCLALWLARQKNKVRFHTVQPTYRENGLGLVTLAPSITPMSKEIVIFDDVGFAKQGAQFRRRGNMTIGGFPVEDWEIKRGIGTRIMQEHGIATPETVSFNTIADAIKFLDGHEGFWFFKPDGKDVPKRLTQGYDSEFLIRYLLYAEAHLKEVPRFQLQKQVKGTEISCCVWINRSGVVAAEATIEEKKYGGANTGPGTGCQANLVWSVDPDGPLVRDTIGHFVPALLEAGYVGMADLNSIITDTGTVYGLEFTMRLGYDCTQARAMLFGEDYGEQLRDFAHNSLFHFTRNEEEYAMTLRLSTLPQPINLDEEMEDDATAYTGIPLDAKLLDDPYFFPDDVKLTPKGPVMTASTGFVGVLGTTGTDINTMRANLLERAKAFCIPDGYWRPDPVSRAEEGLDFLERWGYAPRLYPVDVTIPVNLPRFGTSPTSYPLQVHDDTSRPFHHATRS